MMPAVLAEPARARNDWPCNVHKRPMQSQKTRLCEAREAAYDGALQSAPEALRNNPQNSLNFSSCQFPPCHVRINAHVLKRLSAACLGNGA